MNLRKVLCLLVLAVAMLFVAGQESDAQQFNPWGRPTHSGYPAYGYQYHNVHHHHYVYRPHYWHWHPAGWGNHGMYGGWYGGGFIWHGPGNCDACYNRAQNGASLYYDADNIRPGQAVSPSQHEDDVPGVPGDDLVPELPELP